MKSGSAARAVGIVAKLAAYAPSPAGPHERRSRNYCIKWIYEPCAIQPRTVAHLSAWARVKPEATEVPFRKTAKVPSPAMRILIEAIRQTLQPRCGRYG